MTGSSEALAIELLVDRATEGLEDARRPQLATLLARHPELDDDSFDLAAAAIELAYTTADQSLPPALRERVIAQAADYFQTTGQESTLAEVARFPAARAERAPRSADSGRWLGWLAAAACLTLAVMSWLPRRQAPGPAEARVELIATADDLLRLEWTATDDPAARAAGGDLVWSTDAQAGFMRFRGLPVNDPSVEQYQLWIFDVRQDERFPVDGGVFNVTAPDEVVVPIDPRLRITEPTLFAVTIEKPGGVVVSSRERLPLLAKVAPATRPAAAA